MKKINLRPLPTFVFMMFVCMVSWANTKQTGEIIRMRELADSLHSIGSTDSAAIIIGKAAELAEESQDPLQIVGTCSSQGVFLRSLGKIDEALKSYEHALEIATSEQFRTNPGEEAIEEIASLYINLAVLNLDMQQKEKAAENTYLSGKWIVQSTDCDLKSTIFGVAGSVLTGCGELEKAMEYQDLAYQNALEAKNSEAAFRAGAYTMLIADRLGNKQEAKVWREKCQSLLPEIQSTMARLVYYQAECSISLKNNDKREALAWFGKILKTEGIDKLPFIKFDCYNNMHQAYAGLGEYDKAYSTLLEGNALRDSLMEQEKTESLRELTVKYKTKETELALARSELQSSNTLLWLFATIGLLLMAVIIFVVYANRQRHRRMQKEIEFANLRADIGKQLTQHYIEGLENERRRMSRELHDGVCNDLLAIQMNICNNNSLDSTARLIDVCRESVRRISHELMPPEFAYASIDEVMKFFVNKQTEACKGKTNFRYTSSTQTRHWSDIPDAVSLEIYRITQEAIGNAIKHANATEINVYLLLEKENLMVSIRDNGTYKVNEKKGLGLESIRQRAKAIDGKLTIQTNTDKGTEIRLDINL